MSLAYQVKRDTGNAERSAIERAKLACRFAKKLEKAGEYEAACEALSEFWPDRHQLPKLDELDDATRGEVLLRSGALAGWLGSTDQTEDSQETAKNLLTRGREIFHTLADPSKEAEAHGELALCYWREGALDEARVQLRAALHLLSDADDELKAVILIRVGIVEATAGRYNEALRFYDQGAPHVERSNDDALKGSFHISLATLLTRLADAENRQDYTDRALIEAAAASFHFEKVGNSHYLARVENNLGFLYFALERYDDAHQHLDRARVIFRELNDIGTAAQVDETRARTLLAQGRLVEAERIVRAAVKTLERGGQQAILAEALTTHGTVMARLGNYARARLLLQRAYEIAQTAGDLEGAGRAKLSVIEELGAQTPANELRSIYRSALELLGETQDTGSRKRLISCAQRLLDGLAQPDEIRQQSQPDTWEGFSFKEHIHDYERVVIERALRDAGGSVTRAAALLGFKHHHSLISLINTRHKELLPTRSAARKRRRHLLSDLRTAKPKDRPVSPSAHRSSSQICILHVEANKAGKLLDDRLSEEGMQVHSCADGMDAMELLKSNERFNIIIVDSDLPGLSGLELVLRVRSLSHRRHTPVILLSANDCEREAWRAGVDAFLRKPKGVDKVPSTIDRLLKVAKAKMNKKKSPR